MGNGLEHLGPGPPSPDLPCAASEARDSLVASQPPTLRSPSVARPRIPQAERRPRIESRAFHGRRMLAPISTDANRETRPWILTGTRPDNLGPRETRCQFCCQFPTERGNQEPPTSEREWLMNLVLGGLEP